LSCYFNPLFVGHHHSHHHKVNEEGSVDK